MPSLLTPLRALAGRILLGLRIWWWWLRIRVGVTRVPLPQLIAQLGGARARRRHPYRPLALGRAVDRTLRVRAWQPACLMKALVLYRLLQEQGDPAELVIGLPPRARDHTAHAWVELDSVDIGPPPGRGDHVPLARFPDRSPAAASTPTQAAFTPRRPGPGDGGAALLNLLREDAPPQDLPEETWSELAQIALDERLGPLAFAAVSRLGEARVPQGVWVALAQRHGQSMTEAAGGYAQLAEVLAFLGEAGLTPVLLKGAALARFTYPTPAHRPFGDLDLLVLAGEVEAAHQALTRAGYAVAGGAPTAADLTWRHARGYYIPGSRRRSVDLHWRFVGYPLLLPLDYAGVVHRGTDVQIDGTRALLPSPADLLVALSISFIREIWYGKRRLRYVCDVAEVVRRHAVDWDQLLRTVRETPLLRTPLLVALRASAVLLGVEIPGAVTSTLGAGSGGAAGYLVARVCRQILDPPRSWDAVMQVTVMRWLDDRSPAAMLRWLQSLIFVPSPLAASQRRWLQRLWGRTA